MKMFSLKRKMDEPKPVKYLYSFRRTLIKVFREIIIKYNLKFRARKSLLDSCTLKSECSECSGHDEKPGDTFH